MSDVGGTLVEVIVAELVKAAPPKVEGGSEARRQWLTDVLAVQTAFGFVPGGMDAFMKAMDEA